MMKLRMMFSGCHRHECARKLYFPHVAEIGKLRGRANRSVAVMHLRVDALDTTDAPQIFGSPLLLPTAQFQIGGPRFAEVSTSFWEGAWVTYFALQLTQSVLEPERRKWIRAHLTVPDVYVRTHVNFT